jgi:trans-2,3-dihydro-3-hydroxyanthranilate isomerase
MNGNLKFFITDVFGEKRYSGNQLATLVNSSSLSDCEMQQIAREINFSETTFVLSDEKKDGGYDVRIFTPKAEIDFAGHPSLGTAYVIREQIIRSLVGEVILNLRVGQIPVRFTDDGMLWMKQVQPEFGKTIGIKRMTTILNVSESDVDTNWPIREVSTGLPCIIVPLKSMEALQRVRIEREQYDQLVNNERANVILVFCPEGYTKEQTLSVRVFPVALGIDEDPATGSGNGCLGAYLVEHLYFDSDSVDITVGQGYEIGRPSSIFIKASKKDDMYRIEVGGRVIPIAEGWWG